MEPATFRKVGLRIKRLKGGDDGLFRDVYRILNTNFVVKFPLSGGKAHTAAEVRRIEKLRQFRFMWPHLPRVEYYDKESGVVVMSYHPPFKDFEEQVDTIGEMLAMLIEKATGVPISDLHSNNIHKGRKNKAVVIDLGY